MTSYEDTYKPFKDLYSKGFYFDKPFTLKSVFNKHNFLVTTTTELLGGAGRPVDIRNEASCKFEDPKKKFTVTSLVNSNKYEFETDLINFPGKIGGKLKKIHGKVTTSSKDPVNLNRIQWLRRILNAP